MLKIKINSIISCMSFSCFVCQINLPFEKLIHALRNFPEDAMDPNTLLPMAYSIKVLSFPPLNGVVML